MADFDDTQLRLGIATIAAAFARTMEQRDPGFQIDFTGNLNAAYSELRSTGSDNTGALEMISWTVAAMKAI